MATNEPESLWGYMPDSVLLLIFNYLRPEDLMKAGHTCKLWNRLCYDEILWKRLLCRNYKVDPSLPIAPGKKSWYEEYKRLIYYTPNVASEVLRDHKNEVIHVSFSHDGTMFATSSKDGYIIVWNSSYPAKVKHKYNMKVFRWKCTQFSQFNKSDTLLLVSGVHFGSSNSTSGEIAVFSLSDGFNLQCRVGNKPYDIFGTWYSDRHLLSGDISWLAHLISTTALWINKASQEIASEHTPILNQLFRFYNTNASSVRAVMVADCTKGCKIVDESTSSYYSSKDESMYEDATYDEDEELMQQPEKLLIFTTGSKTYTPHQIGFKIIKNVKFPKFLPKLSIKETLAKRREMLLASPQNVVVPNWQDFDAVSNKFDHVDHIMDLHGHIIGMALSPDHRYLFVNSRPWPPGYTITNPLEPPPIAQEIDIHVIDLVNFCKVGKTYGSHKAYTPNSECFFIFLDVSNEYLASGSEDKLGYLWDRHYGICLSKLPHGDVVNSVAFNPYNSGVLVSTSDDFEIKVWRSRAFLDKEIGKEARSCMTHAITSFKRH